MLSKLNLDALSLCTATNESVCHHLNVKPFIHSSSSNFPHDVLCTYRCFSIMSLLPVRSFECVLCTSYPCRSALLYPSAVRGAWSLGYMQAVVEQTCPSRYFPFRNSASVSELSEREMPSMETDRLLVKGVSLCSATHLYPFSTSRPLIKVSHPQIPCLT
jgi:hypothetical protein